MMVVRCRADIGPRLKVASQRSDNAPKSDGAHTGVHVDVVGNGALTKPQAVWMNTANPKFSHRFVI